MYIYKIITCYIDDILLTSREKGNVLTFSQIPEILPAF